MEYWVTARITACLLYTSEYSLLDGSNKIKEYVARVKELGMNSAAITDHGVMYGCIDFYRAVSYTHLDVYKRQTFHIPQAFWRKPRLWH